MEEIKIAAEARKEKGKKKELSGFRSNFRIPGVIYGSGRPALKVVLSEKELMTVRKNRGANAILHLTLGSDTETVILKDLQRHPVTDRPVHVDFQRISLTQKIEARVALRIIGQAPGVKLSGGVMQHELRVLAIRALPSDIPQYIEVDVSGLEIGQNILVKALKVPAQLEILDSPDHIVVHVTQVKVEAAAEAPAAAVAQAATQAEPGISSTKGKKDEEGKPLPKEAKAAAPEKGKEAAKKEGAK